MIPMFKVYTDNDKCMKNMFEVLDSGMLGEGPKVKEFTSRLCELFQNPYVVCLNSCTSALTLAVRLALNDKLDRQNVLSTPFTMIATNCAISAAAKDIEWTDISPETLCMDFDHALKCIGGHEGILSGHSEVGAVMVTLVGGSVPPGLDVFWQELKDRGIALILDAAHAIDTHYKGKHIANWGDYVCFSFQSIKSITTGDGGAIVFNALEEYNRGEKLKWFGITREVPEGVSRLEHQMTADVEKWGYKYHMNDCMAALGLANFDGGLTNVKKCRDNVQYLTEGLQNLKQITLPTYELESVSSWWVFGLLAERRDELIKHMENRGVVTTPMWRRNDEYSTFNKSRYVLENMNNVQDKVVFVPSGWWLMKEDLDHIVRSIDDFYK